MVFGFDNKSYNSCNGYGNSIALVLMYIGHHNNIVSTKVVFMKIRFTKLLLEYVM